MSTHSLDRFDTLGKCDKQITKLSKQLAMLTMHKQSMCTHDVIKLQGFRDDDNTWVHYLTCQNCGLQGRSAEHLTFNDKKKTIKDVIFKLLESLYDATDWRHKEYICDKERQISYEIAYIKGKSHE